MSEIENKTKIITSNCSGSSKITFQCGFCELIFQTPQGRRKHEKKKHQNMKICAENISEHSWKRFNIHYEYPNSDEFLERIKLYEEKIRILESENELIRKEYSKALAKIDEFQNRSKEIHLSLTDQALCTIPVTNRFEEQFKEKIATLRSKKTIAKYYDIKEKYFQFSDKTGSKYDDIANAREFVNSIISEKGKGSSKNKSIEKFLVILKMITGKSHNLPKAPEEDAKEKVLFSKQNLLHFLEFLRRYLDFSQNEEEKMKNLSCYIISLGLISYGIRLCELSTLPSDRIAFIGKKVEFFLSKVNRYVKIQVSSKFINLLRYKHNLNLKTGYKYASQAVLEKFKINLESKTTYLTNKDKLSEFRQKEKFLTLFPEISDWEVFIRDKLIHFYEKRQFSDRSSKMKTPKEHLNLTQADRNEKKAIGPHCLRKSLITRLFTEGKKKKLELIKNVTKQMTDKAVDAYIDQKFKQYFWRYPERTLKDFKCIGRKRLSNPLELDLVNKLTNFKYTRSLYLNEKINSPICPNCNLFIKDDYLECSNCSDTFHNNCSFFYEGCCHTCAYSTSATGYKVRLELLKKVPSCLICNSADKGVKMCLKCSSHINSLLSSMYEFSDVIIKLKIPKITKEQEDLYNNSLNKALLKRGLIFTEKNIYHDCHNLPQNHLDLCKISKQNKRVFYSKVKSPIALFNHRKLGYAVHSQAKIKKYTLICEYNGDVFTQKIANNIECDSRMTLINNPDSEKSVVICPVVNSNIARFISGSDKEEYINLSPISFEIDGEIHILLYAIKDIEELDILYYDYGCKYQFDGYESIKKYNINDPDILDI